MKYYLIVAVITSLLFSQSKADWWVSVPLSTARTSWLEIAESNSMEARAKLVALLKARQADSHNRAAIIWKILHHTVEFPRAFAEVLAVSHQDELVHLLADSSLDIVDLLHQIAADKNTAKVEVRAAALEILSLIGGQREIDYLLKVLLDAHEEAVLRTIAGEGLLSNSVLNLKDHKKLLEALDRPKPQSVQITLMKLVSLRPNQVVIHRSSLLARSRRNQVLQAAALNAFITSCKRESEDELTLAEAHRGFAEIKRSAATPLEEAASLSAQRWLEPKLFEEEMRNKAKNIASWRRYFTDEHAPIFWLDAVFEYGALEERREVDIVDEIIKLLSTEPPDSAANLSKVLFTLTEQHPRWLVDALLRELGRQKLAAVESIADIPEPNDRDWNLWQKAGEGLSWIWEQRISPDILTSLLVRTFQKDREAERLVDGTLAIILGQPKLEEAALNARLLRLRNLVSESVLQGSLRVSLWKIAQFDSEIYRVRALERLVSLREGRAALKLAEEHPARVLVALFGNSPKNRVPPNVKAFAELGVFWLKHDPKAPISALKKLFGKSVQSGEKWTPFWRQLLLISRKTGEVQTIVEERLYAICRASENHEVRAVWQIIANSNNKKLAKAARYRLR